MRLWLSFEHVKQEIEIIKILYVLPRPQRTQHKEDKSITGERFFFFFSKRDTGIQDNNHFQNCFMRVKTFINSNLKDWIFSEIRLYFFLKEKKKAKTKHVY